MTAQPQLCTGSTTVQTGSKC